MRILRSIHSLNPAVGGPRESVIQSSLVLTARGHEVEVVCLDSPDRTWLREFPVEVHALGPGLGSYGYTSRFVPWLKKHRDRYDAVIVQGVWQYNSFGVWRGLRGTAIPYFVFLHGMLDPWFQRTYPMKHWKKVLYWELAERRVLRNASAVLFTSAEEQLLAGESFSLNGCNQKVVGYGTAAPSVDLETAKAEFLNAFPQLKHKRFLLFLGRLHEKKGCEILIQALASIGRAATTEFQLVMAGPTQDQDYFNRLQQLVAQSGLDGRVIFPGMLNGAMKWGAFAAADAFVLPSHQENFGIAVVESLAAGLPVLISNRVNIWREIEQDGAGYVESDDFSGTVRLLDRWIAAPESVRAGMRANARRCFERRFEIHKAVDSLLEVLNESIANR